MIPIIFTHKGNQDYVKVAIKQASQWNERVILLGDTSNMDWDVEHYQIVAFWDGDAERAADYYVHMCSNPHDFELYNVQEFFILREFMRQRELTKIFACDSDVMIYADLTEEERKFGDYLAIYSIPEEQWDYRWSASAHSVYWTFGGLCSFCEFIEKTYTTEAGLAKLREKWQWHQDSGTGGGICDMTLLYLFYLENAHLIHDICQVRDGVTFDHNIRVGENAEPYEYVMGSEESKLVFWVRDRPFGERVNGQHVRFATLHFQNGAKPLMESYYRERP